jgi:hypothetical protein
MQCCLATKYSYWWQRNKHTGVHVKCQILGDFNQIHCYCADFLKAHNIKFDKGSWSV